MLPIHSSQGYVMRMLSVVALILFAIISGYCVPSGSGKECGPDGAAELPRPVVKRPVTKPAARARVTFPCGNGKLDRGELCDTRLAPGAEGACPTDCDDSDPCTKDLLQGRGTCQAHCLHVDWCASAPQSAYFQSDAVAEAILAGERVYDLATEFPLGCGYDLGAQSDSWGVKLFNGLKQGGYINSLTCSTVGDMLAEKLLQHFQQGQGLPLSTTLDRAGMTRLDEIVLAAEQRVASRNVASEFACWSVLREAPPLNNSKAHVGFLHLLAYESFPAALRLTAAECFDHQLGLSNNGVVVWDSMTWPEVGLDGSLRKPYALSGLVSVDDYTVVATAVHEFAHVLDGDIYEYPRPGGVPRIATAGFIDISYEYASRYRDGWVYYRLRPDPDDPDALRQNFFSYGIGWQHDTKAGYYTAAEDFATCVSMYVLHGAVFRDYLATRPLLAAKYAWIREHVFDGVEFATGDPGYAAYAPDLWDIGYGCFDVTCFQELRVLVEPGYVWGYAIPIIARQFGSGETNRNRPGLLELRVPKTIPVIPQHPGQSGRLVTD